MSERLVHGGGWGQGASNRIDMQTPDPPRDRRSRMLGVARTWWVLAAGGMLVGGIWERLLNNQWYPPRCFFRVHHRVSSFAFRVYIDYQASSLVLRASSIEVRVPRFEYRVLIPSVEFRVSSILLRFSSVECRLSSFECFEFPASSVVCRVGIFEFNFSHEARHVVSHEAQHLL